jgi:SAM-dependent methyltransferase
MTSQALVRMIGWPATILHGDPLVFDRWQWLRKHLARGKKRTLDAGCGAGAFTLYAAKNQNEATGISFDDAMVRKASERARILKIKNASFIRGDLRLLDQLAPELGQFDQVICCETIEHIVNDAKLLRDIAALMKTGARLLLTTPFKDCPPLRGDKLSALEDGGHVRWGYTHAEMRALMLAAGLDVESEEFVSGYISQRITNAMRRASTCSVTLGWAATFPLRLLQVIDRAVTNTARRPYLSIAVVARKRG